jgi:ubiquinone/menaquinone biosynthesis C-methylase UbiE
VFKSLWQKWMGRDQAKMRPIVVDERSIRESFELSAADDEHFPQEIDPRIQHVRRVIDALQTQSGFVLDAGSGKGRHAKHVAAELPKLKPVCLDLSHAMLKHVALPSVAAQASLQQLPFANQSFAGAYAIESLEHVPDPQHCVAELCRVLQPGAPIVIIDKNAEHWGRLPTPAWERWFYQSEVESWLQPFCHQIHSQPLSYWADVAPDGLFLIWHAVKR